VLERSFDLPPALRFVAVTRQSEWIMRNICVNIATSAHWRNGSGVFASAFGHSTEVRHVPAIVDRLMTSTKRCRRTKGVEIAMMIRVKKLTTCGVAPDGSFIELEFLDVSDAKVTVQLPMEHAGGLVMTLPGQSKALKTSDAC
jgi:hypothetical protein